MTKDVKKAAAESEGKVTFEELRWCREAVLCLREASEAVRPPPFPYSLLSPSAL